MGRSALTVGTALCAGLLALPFSCLGEDDDFNWAWEPGDKAATGRVQRTAQAEQDKDAFQWSWEEGQKKPAQTDAARGRTLPSPTPQPQPRREPAPSKTPPGVGASAYNELLKENLELRKQVEAAAKARDEERREKEALKNEIRDLEQRLADVAQQLRSARDTRPAPAVDLDKVVELEAKLSEAEDQKARLKEDLDSLQKSILELQEARGSGRAQTPSSGVQPGSDLFEEIKRENTLLKNRVARLETELKKASRSQEKIEEEDARTRERARDLEEALEQARDTEKAQRRRIGDLMEQIPDMEEELARLQEDLEKKDKALSTKEKDLETMLVELRRRELRLMKAERMAELLDKTRDEVKQIDERQKIDMHFNMAAVYAKEGRLGEAEQEYLRALRLDPNDAEVHYNLAILYDDELNKPGRAALHYRKYLKLRPHAPDVDQVKQWLMRIELNR